MEGFFDFQLRVFHPYPFEGIGNLGDGVEQHTLRDNDCVGMKSKGLSPVQYRTQPSNSPSVGTVQRYWFS